MYLEWEGLEKKYLFAQNTYLYKRKSFADAIVCIKNTYM